MMSTSTTRRTALLSAIAGAAFVTTASVASTEGGGDVALLALGRDFDTLLAEFKSESERWEPLWGEFDRITDDWKVAHPGHTPAEYSAVYKRTLFELSGNGGRLLDDILDDLDPIVQAIIRSRGATLAGLAVKARVAKFNNSDMWEASDADADLGPLCARSLIDAVLEAARSQQS